MDEKFYEEEERCDHLVTTEVKKLWAVELDLLDQIKRICEKHDLKYFAIGGTLLGAARHKGFIPWDDDIDLGLLPEDYNKLCQIAPGELSYPYFFQCYETDAQCYVGHDRIRRSDTTGFTKHEKEYCSDDYNFGIAADIFCLYNIPDLKLKQKLHKLAIRLVRLAVRGEELDRWQKRKGEKPGSKRLALIWYWRILSLFTDAKGIRSAYQKVCGWEKKKTKRVGIVAFAGYNEKMIWDRAIFDSAVELPFENTTISCPGRYEECLTNQFGDWHVPVKGAACHEMAVVDADVPYAEKMKEA